MRHRIIRLIIALTGVLACSPVIRAQNAPRAAKAKAAEAFDPRDLSGVWMKPKQKSEPGGTPVVMTVPPPMTPLGLQKFNANKPSYGPRAVPPALGNDPMGNCDPLGMPRELFMEVSVYNMQIVPTPQRVFQFFEWAHTWREIWTDGRPLPANPEPSWMGHAVGKWDGGTFVVDSVGFDERSWLDHFGQPHSDELRVQERYRRLDHDTLEMGMTFTDPKIYTRPWIGENRILKLVPSGEFSEIFCVPSEEQSFNKRIRDPAAGKVTQ